MPKQDQIRAVHTLIHIGCGANPNIDEYISLAEHVWLIDADTEVITKLEEITQAQENDLYKNVHTRLTLVDDKQRKTTFYRYSLPWASGIIPIDEKTQRLYPGLQCLSSEEKTTTAIDTLVKECLSLTESENIDKHMLLLGCGYQNEALLQALEGSEELSRFISVVVLPAHRQQKPIAVPPTLYGSEQSSLNLTLPKSSEILVRHPLIEVIKKMEQEMRQECEKRQQQLLERDQQLAECNKQLSECAQQRNEINNKIEGLNKEKVSLKKQLEDKDDKIASSKQKVQEQYYRNLRLEQEIIKLEAQLELIKNVLLQEKAF